jgi:hypothetical protein
MRGRPHAAWYENSRGPVFCGGKSPEAVNISTDFMYFLHANAVSLLRGLSKKVNNLAEMRDIVTGMSATQRVAL